ncbi:uncharacterized protein LOC123559410 [Mercenaria mercenaria]|uniref:uncharacterized protein LOC123559410 n=1 Tax=Mercenaria mercenaria TaxID=6596 RepID=UPI00234F7878|nr:uncharacterized protein LOC123559410 [Mercenaria mercenaria]
MKGRNIVSLVYMVLIYLVISVSVTHGTTTHSSTASSGTSKANNESSATDATEPKSTTEASASSSIIASSSTTPTVTTTLTNKNNSSTTTNTTTPNQTTTTITKPPTSTSALTTTSSTPATTNAPPTTEASTAVSDNTTSNSTSSPPPTVSGTSLKTITTTTTTINQSTSTEDSTSTASTNQTAPTTTMPPATSSTTTSEKSTTNTTPGNPLTSSIPVTMNLSTSASTTNGTSDLNATTSLPSSTTSTAPSSTTITPESTPTAGGASTQPTQQTTPDPCESFPCGNGTCSVSNGSAACLCKPGYTGLNCDTNINECDSNPCKNGATCVDGINNYTCTCPAGFEGRNCNQNIDDCTPNPCLYGGNCTDGVNTYTCHCAAGYDGRNCSNNIDDCKPNPCQNGGNCTDGVNTFTCQCAAGYDGRNCSNNINECQSNPCQNGGTCKDGVNMYTCSCAAGFNGTNCGNNIDECQSNPCQNGGNCTDGDNMYTCTCVTGFNGTNCDHDIDDCVGVVCNNGGTCEDGINSYTCNCAAEWEGTHCKIDVDECSRKTHKCDKNANCTNTEGSYNCTCKSGFTGDGFSCQDINECSNTTLCQNGATCFNTPGSFVCYCTEYWTGIQCQTDIDECNTSKCADNAFCNNTNDGYNCICNEGYRGDGHKKCFRKTLIPMSSNTWHSGDDNVFGPVTLPEVMYYFGKPYNTFYVSMNGYVTLGQYLDQRYPPEDTSAWSIYDFPIIAPLWSDIVTEGQNSGVSFDVARDSTTLEQIGHAMNTPRPSFSITATWKTAVPYPFDQNNEHEAADFQVIISKVGVDTILMFNYDQEFFTWKSTGDKLVSVGYSNNKHDGTIKFEEDTFTQTNMQGSDGVNGSWVFNVTSSTSNWGTESLCLSAVSNDSTAAIIESARSLADPCPCSIEQIKRDRRFKRDVSNEYVSRFSRGTDSVRQRCHYSVTGSLLRGYPGGGYLETGQIKEVHKKCCINSSRCDLFYHINPSDTCAGYNPPSLSSSWGDPHITTLDGARYTFNGRGEFTLLKIEEKDAMANVQVRTELASTTNKDATVFVGLAAQVGETENGDKVELILNRTSQSCRIYANGVFKETALPTKKLNHINLGGLEIFSDPNDDANKTIIITFSARISIQIHFSDILNIVASVPRDAPFHGKTTGLLGNNNDNDTDDFRPRNDSSNPLSKNSSEEDLYKFGITWRVSKEESLFSYNISGGSYLSYNDESIRPNAFISDEINRNTIGSYINKTCGFGNINITHCGDNLACMVDAAATCNEAFGLHSKATEDTVNKEKKTLDHKPPNITQPDPLYIKYTQNHIMNFTFEFPVDVQTNISVPDYTCENCTSFSLNVSGVLRKLPAYLNITAKDNMNATSEYRPDIYYCGCMKESQCDYSLIVQDGPVGGSEGKFFRARCNCSEDTEGGYCEQKVDRCAGTSCYTNVTCNSNVSAPNNPCGPCPAGLEGDGLRCFDKNECYLGISQCGQICENTDGSYICKCNQGYELDADGYSCNDINECELQDFTCESNMYCENTIGGYDCKCNPGYLKGTGKGCVEGKASYGGILVFKTIVQNEEKLKAEIKMFLMKTYKDGGIDIVDIEITLEEISDATRKRREVTSGQKWNAHFVLHTQYQNSTENVREVLTTKLKKITSNNDGYGAIDGPFPILLSIGDSGVYTDEEGGVCNIEGKTKCDPISTTCHSENGTAVCRCKRPFFDGWVNPHTSCKDVDECLKKDEICQGGNCTNTPGSYICSCSAGYIYDGKAACTDMCSPNPCQNDGLCIHGELQGQFLCKCDDKWTGPKCEDKNAEAEKLKTIAIAVGASIGGICLILLFALFGMYRRHRNRYSRYNRRPLSSLDNDSSFGLASSNIRTKDFPIDDDTDTQYSVPRPKVNRNGYEMKENDGASNEGFDGSEAGKMEEPKKPLTQTTKETSETGQENPSFLHSQELEEARRTSKRQSKNAYDYF